MKIYDLSQTIRGGMPVYPGDPPTLLTGICTCEADGYNLSALSMSPHSGTHMDAPRHFIGDGAGVDEVPLESCVGRALTVSVSPGEGNVISTEAFLEKVDKNKQPDEHILLVKTGHGRRYGSDDYYTAAPTFASPMGEALQKRGFTAIGVDMPSVTLAQGRIRDGHVDLFSHGLVIIENLRLAEQEAEHCFFSAAPIKIEHGDGAPVRAFAVEIE